MTRRLPRPSAWAFALLLLSCGEPGDGDRAFDGGRAIDRRPPIPGLPELRARDPCWRRERGGWHNSVVHCERMTAPERMTGVWITGFEEQSFIRGPTAMPDPTDPRRFRNEIEIDGAEAQRLMRRPFGYGYSVIAITFIGRRTLYPYLISCDGQHSHTFHVDRLESARYLGLMPETDLMPVFLQRSRMRFQPTGAGGVIGRLEAETAERCNR